MQGRLFVLKLLKDIRRRVLSKNDIRPETEIKTINYEKALKIIKGIIIINKYIESFFINFKRRIEIIEFTTTLNEPKFALGEKPIKNADSNKKNKI